MHPLSFSGELALLRVGKTIRKPAVSEYIKQVRKVGTAASATYGEA